MIKWLRAHWRIVLFAFASTTKSVFSLKAGPPAISRQFQQTDTDMSLEACLATELCFDSGAFATCFPEWNTLQEEFQVNTRRAVCSVGCGLTACKDLSSLRLNELRSQASGRAWKGLWRGGALWGDLTRPGEGQGKLAYPPSPQKNFEVSQTKWLRSGARFWFWKGSGRDLEGLSAVVSFQITSVALTESPLVKGGTRRRTHSVSPQQPGDRI